jgi:hypothetical protein
MSLEGLHEGSTDQRAEMHRRIKASNMTRRALAENPDALEAIRDYDAGDWCELASRAGHRRPSRRTARLVISHLERRLEAAADPLAGLPR